MKNFLLIACSLQRWQVELVSINHLKRENMVSDRTTLHLLDCTLRDGGYYNAWDFSPELINRYLIAMKAAQIDIVEIGFRFLKNDGFKGPCAFSTDDFLRSLDIPSGLTIGVMINGADLCGDIDWRLAIEYLFPEPSSTTPLKLVRLACHFDEIPNALSAARWLVERGYRVGLNLMQIADRTQAEVEQLGELARASPIEVLYFADSMGSMTPEDTSRIISWLKKKWHGPIGIHTHDSMGLALANTLCAKAEGVNWLDATVTGMGRGPGNARMEELVIEADGIRGRHANLVPLMSLIRDYFAPLKTKHAWGVNPYYYLAGKHGIHPSYIQEMLSNTSYDEEDIFAVIEYLRKEGGKKFNFNTLSGAKQFYRGEPHGTWAPITMMRDREVLILGAGPGVDAHRVALETYIRRAKPIVLALNTNAAIDINLIDFWVACHPVRLLADAATHTNFPQPLITPASMLPDNVRTELKDKKLLDFGLGIEPGQFSFHATYCVAPASLVLAYALALSTSGMAKRILMAGFDGYAQGDLRNTEVETMLTAYRESNTGCPIFSITPTQYRGLESWSIYGIR